VLPGDVLDENAKEFAEQAFRVLDRERTEIRFNGEWLGKLSYAEVVRLARTITVARILERDDFAQRFAAREPISISELLYPLMQAYDSVAIEADIEIGGTDQLYNLLAGRDVMQDYGLDPQLVMTYPLLVGLDGEDKMSKSRGNYIGINDPPEEMFGKTMSIPDKALPQWWELVVGGGPHPDARGRVGDDALVTPLACSATRQRANLAVCVNSKPFESELTRSGTTKDVVLSAAMPGQGISYSSIPGIQREAAEGKQRPVSCVTSEQCDKERERNVKHME
jgi:hypothetical protein